MAHDVFVSYASEDKATADALVATLEQHQIRCWSAPRDIPAGRVWGEAIIDAIDGARVMVLVFSDYANRSGHVMRELERAASKGVAILPLRIEDVAPSKSMEFFISSTHWLDALTPPLKQHLEQLARNVAALLDAARDAPGTQTAAPRAASAPVTLELGTPRANGPFGARLAATSFDLTLRNSRGDSVEVELDADDAEGHCSFSLPEAVTVPPSGATTVTVKVRPRARRWRGEREIRWFSVMASSGEGGQPPAIVSGQFEDLPYGWVPYGGAVVGAVVAAVLAVSVTQGVGGGGGPATPTPPSQSSPSVAQTPASEDTAGPSLDVDAATAILDRAVAAKDLSNQGQVEALETLLAQGYGYENADLSGIRLAGANLDRGVFRGTMLAGTDLSQSTAKEADFAEAHLSFANLNGADLTEANLEDARAWFAGAESTVFTNAKASRASFYGASLRGADFSNADLRGASFVMADLSGARLDGANLEDTLFYATLLEDATFEGATFSNTEITGSALPEGALTSGQAANTCTTLDDMASPSPLTHALIEEIPNSRFSGGIEYSDLMEYEEDMFYLAPFSTSGLARCAMRSENQPGIWSANGIEYVLTDWRAFYDTALISKAGRRSDWVSRIVNHMSMITATLKARQGD